jgi:hypothetical protein
MNVKTRQMIEKRIARKFIQVALAAGYAISLDNGGHDFEFEHSSDFKVITGAMHAMDEERLHLSKDGKHIGWVFFVYGNDGWDVICNYTVNLEHLMPEVSQLCERLEERYA